MKVFSAKNWGTGAFVLIISGFVCKVLGALFRLPLTNLLGIDGIGVFQMIMSLYAFALVVTCGGVSVSLSKLISSARARGETEKIRVFLNRAIFVTLILAFSLGIVFVALTKVICRAQGISVNFSYMLFVLLLPFGGLLAVFRGYFQGYENMTPTAVSQIFEQVFKFAFGLFFAWILSKKSVALGVFGAFLGITLSEFVSLLYLLILLAFRHEKKQNLDVALVRSSQKDFDRANFALTLSASVLPLVNAFDAMIVVPHLAKAGFSNGFATTLFGLQSGVVGAILNFPLIISMSVATAFLPNVSYLASKGANCKFVVAKGLKVLLYLVLPTTFGCVAISKPLLSLLYKGMNDQLLDISFNLMLFGGFSIVFTAIVQYLLMLLQSRGEYKFVFFSTLIGGAIKAILTFSLSYVPQINIFSIVLGNIFLSSIVCLSALLRLKKVVQFRLELKDLSILVFGTALMFLAVYTFLNCNYFSSLTNLTLAVLLGIVVYGVTTFVVIYKLIKNQKIRASA